MPGTALKPSKKEAEEGNIGIMEEEVESSGGFESYKDLMNLEY